VKESSTEVPDDYNFKNSTSLNRALNHTSVKLTWDETDPKRLKKFQKIMDTDPDKLDDDVYKEFLASGTEDEEELEEDDIAGDQDKIDEYRRKLLGALSENKADPFRKRNLQASDDEGEVESDSDNDKELDIKFNVGFGEDVGQKLLK
jgi:hypothetical protein